MRQSSAAWSGEEEQVDSERGRGIRVVNNAALCVKSVTDALEGWVDKSTEVKLR